MLNIRSLCSGILGCLLLLLLLSPVLSAQTSDSLFAVFKDNRMVINHQVRSGETVFMLARRFKVPAAVISDINKLSYQDNLRSGSRVLIPVDAYNYLRTKPHAAGQSKPLYYKVARQDNIRTISRKAGISPYNIQKWNGLFGSTVKPGQSLLVGWIAYDSKEMPDGVGNTTPGADQPRPGSRIVISDVLDKDGLTDLAPAPADTIILPPPPASPEEKLYLQQTNNEHYAMEEKGTAVFFKMEGRVTGTSSFFAFHNSTSRGTIIKVLNPGTGQVVYVKVLGPIPGTKQYHNSVIAISSGAQKVLGVTENRMWAELKYASGF